MAMFCARSMSMAFISRRLVSFPQSELNLSLTYCSWWIELHGSTPFASFFASRSIMKLTSFTSSPSAYPGMSAIHL